jgi:hypothetical protein
LPYSEDSEAMNRPPAKRYGQMPDPELDPADWPALDTPQNQGQIIATTIRDLAIKQLHLSRFIDRCMEQEDQPPLRDLIRLLALHGQNASRLGRLLRDQQALSDPAADELNQAINQALDELSAEWGVEL